VKEIVNVSNERQKLRRRMIVTTKSKSLLILRRSRDL